MFYTIHYHHFAIYNPVPDVAPLDISGIVTDSRTLTYSWNEIPCGARGGEVLSYYYELEDDFGSIVRNDSVPSSASMVTLDNLEPCHGYSFRVTAVTSIGKGPFTSDLRNVTATEGKKNCS